jgi:hypothetical protein
MIARLAITTCVLFLKKIVDKETLPNEDDFWRKK